MRRALGTFTAYLALAAAYSWPLLRHLPSLLPSDPADPLLNTAILWWNATTLPFSGAWWNAPHYFPTAGVAAFTENLVGLYPLFSPVYWVTGNPIAAYNVAYFLTWPLSAFAAWLLVRRLTGREDAALVAGLAFGFTPYRTAEIAHIQSLSSYGLPIALLGLHAFLTERRARWLWLFGAAWLLQSLANGYYMLFSAVLVGLWLAYFCSTGQTWRAGLWIMAAWIVASLPLVPVMYKYSVIHEHVGLVRNINEVLAYSARPHSWAEVSGDVWFWRLFFPQGKDDLFPGLTALALVLVASVVLLVRKDPSRNVRSGASPRSLSLLRAGLALVVTASLLAIGISLGLGPWSMRLWGVIVRVRDLNRPLVLALASGGPLLLLTPRTRNALARRSPFVFYAGMAVVIALLCCGPVLHVGEAVLLSPAPYGWLMAFPGFSELRVPPRFWMLGVLCLSVAAGLAFRIIRPPQGQWTPALLVFVAAGLLLDGWMPTLRMATPAVPWPVVEPSARAEPILELPIGPDWDWDAMFRAVGHRRRVFNGVSGYDPPHYVALRAGLDDHDPAMLAALASLGPLDVVVNSTADPDGRWDQYVSKAAGVSLVADDGARRLYRIAEGPPEPVLGEPIRIAGVQAFRHNEILASNDKAAPEIFDGMLATGWGDYPQEPGQWLVVDLGSVHDVGGVTHSIGEYFLDFPRRLAIELSLDGLTWERVFEGPTASQAFLALVRGPREGAMRFAFTARPARFVRLLQLDRFNSMWRVSEVQVHAPLASSEH